ncbi:type II toxin-antitoxin system VapC family toxin (plasmid) [Nitrobacter sp. NHB1]|uniref:type II toxin-antitoxin system VapC family toxin n=1 Tax=Nitrobacter sp. NHB1 TaxID=3119830 RepID=UPI002FFDB41B
MLDTNIVSDLIRNPAGRVAGHLASVGDNGLAVSIITAAELRFGAAKSRSAKLLSRVEAALLALAVLPFDVPADAEYAGIRAELEAAGQTIGPNDLLIAAHAYSLGTIMVTANVGEFSRIRGLKVENWLE